MSQTKQSRTLDNAPLGLKLAVLVLSFIAGFVAVGSLMVSPGCGTPAGVEAQAIAASATELAVADGKDPAQLTGAEAEHYVTLAAQKWAAEHQGFDWKGIASIAISTVVALKTGGALIMPRGRDNLSVVLDSDIEKRERLQAALAILVGAHSPPAAKGIAPQS